MPHALRRRRLVGLALSALSLISACGPSLPQRDANTEHHVDPPGTFDAIADARKGVDDPALADLLARHWAQSLADDPVWATKYGFHAFDQLLGDGSLAGVEKRRRRAAAFLTEARALHPGTAGDRLTLSLFIGQLEDDEASQVCAFETWNVGTYANNPVSRWNALPEDHQVKTAPDGQNLLARYRKIPRAIDDEIDKLRHGAASGRVATAESMKRVIAMVDKQLAQPVADWPLAEPAKAKRAGFSEAERQALSAGLIAAIEGGIRPAIQRYRDALSKELLPKARGEDKVGVSALPDGARCYQTQIRAHTTLDRGADELHVMGLQEIARDDAELLRLGEKLFGLHDLPAVLARLRSDPGLHFKSAEEIEEKATRTLSSARQRLGDYFGILPKTDCVVRRIAEAEAPFTTVAYYREPNPDGSLPGAYMINVHAPETRPRYEAQVLAFHESIPGHHLQIAIAQEQPAVPAFRRFFAPTAYTEGWALYVERVADEMGLYEGDLDRLGMVSFDAWRASRLVVDTGIHRNGWSREQAVQFMLAHTALAEDNIRNEVDRYIFWPGQALGYKVGQLTILALRRRAEAELGKRFELKGFHDTVLGAGAVTLTALEARVAAWIAARKGS